jgi:hypothetical protein
VFKYFKRKKAAKKVLIAADKMAQRLQSLPWCNVFEVSFGADHYCAKFERSPD